MDPVSIISLVEACSGLYLSLGKVIGVLTNLATTYKQVALSIKSLSNECKTIKVAIERLQNWIESQTEGTNVSAEVWEQLRESLDHGEVVVNALEEELKPLGNTGLLNGFRRKSKATWFLQALKMHEDRIRGQVGGLTLLLQIVNLPSPSGQTQILEEQAQVFRKASESAWTVFDSNASISTWRGSTSSTDSVDMSYKRLSFEDLLFTSFVYKRNFRNRRTARTTNVNVTATGEAQSSNPTSDDASVVSVQARRPANPAGALNDARETSFARPPSPHVRLGDVNDSWPMRATGMPAIGPSDCPASCKLDSSVPPGELQSAKRLTVQSVEVNADLPHANNGINSEKVAQLHLAVEMDQLSMAALLLRSGALADLTALRGHRPLVMACKRGNLEMVKLLIEYGASVNHHTAFDEEAPIHAAVRSGNAELVKHLCELGINTESIADLFTPSWTPVQLACFNNKPAVVQALLKNGAKPPSSSTYTNSSWNIQPLVIAVRERNAEVIDTILELDPKAFFRREPGSGSTVLHDFFAVYSVSAGASDSQSTLRILLGCPWLLSSLDDLGNSPLHIAAAIPNAKRIHFQIPVAGFIQTIITAGADTRARNHAGHDPLYVACLKGTVIAVVTLLWCGASVIPHAYGDPHSHYGALLDRHDTLENVTYLQTLLDRALTDLAFRNQWSPQAWFDGLEVLDGRFGAEPDLEGPKLTSRDPNNHHTRRNEDRVMGSIQHLRNSSNLMRENSPFTSSSKPNRLQQESNPTLIQNNSQRRGRLNRQRSQEDIISPAESISIVGLEQLLPKPDKTPKGEGYAKWKKQQCKLQRLQVELCVKPSLENPQPIPEEPDDHDANRSEDLRPISDVEPSLVASSDVLGAGNLPQFPITPKNLRDIAPRDPQENVQQFLSFQHLPVSVPSALPISSTSLAPAPSRLLSQTADGANWI